jgi:tetratricopeptide (TPR) repeat protein
MNTSKDFFRILILLVFSFGTSFLFGQEKGEIDSNDPRKSEEDIQIEDRFVTAKYFALIGKNDKAIKILDTLRREVPTNAMVFYESARIYYGQKDYNQTESNLNTALKLNGSNLAIQDFAAKFYLDLGKDDEYIKLMTTKMAQNPSYFKNYDALVSFYKKKERYSDAMSTLDKKKSVLGWSTMTTIQRAEVYDLMGQVAAAETEIKELINNYPLEIDYLKLMTAMLSSNGNEKEAIPYYQKILALSPDDNDAKLAIMVIENKSIGSDSDYLSMMHPLISNPAINVDTKIKELLPLVTKHAEYGDTILGKNLIAICDKLVITHPNDAKGHAVYGDVLMNGGKTEAAVRQYEKSLSYSKRNFMVWEQLMYGLDHLANYEQLLKTATNAIDYFPNNATSYYFSAKASAFQKDYKTAESMLNESSLIGIKNVNIEVKVAALQGYIEWKKGNTQKGIQLLESAISKSQSKYATAFKWLGDIYQSQNQSQKATEMYQKARSLQ